MRAPELTPSSEKIERIISRISSGDIKIPAFQRPFVWKQSQVIELLESIVSNFPIGSILLWNTSERLKFSRNIAGYTIPETDLEYPVNYVLDGQQRLSSIYGVFCENIKQVNTSSKYNPAENIFEIYYDLVNKKFVSEQEVLVKDNCIRMRQIIDASHLISILSEIPEIYRNDVKLIYSKLNNYEVPIVTIKNRDKSEVGEIFERINNTGTKLSTLDLMIAWTWTGDFHFMNEIENFIEELDEKNFGSISRNLLLQIISGLLQDDTRTSSILNLSGDSVRNNWSVVKESIKKGIDFLATEINCKSIDFLPFHQQLAGISKFFHLIKKPSHVQVDYLKKWFWRQAFSSKYFTGQTTEKMNIDIQLMKEIYNNNYDNFETIRHNIRDLEIKNTKFSIASHLTRSILLLLSQSNPLDLCNGSRIDLGASLSSYNRKEYHHIFPNAYLKSLNVDDERINCVANFCFLPADSNKIIRDKKPSEYFKTIIPNEKRNDILESNLIPIDYDIYKSNNYNMFIDKRTQLIIDRVKFLSGQE